MKQTPTPVIAIIGMGPGVSFGIAKKFGKEGFRIAMVSRSVVRLKEYKEKLNDLGITAESFSGDSSNFASLKVAIDNIYEQMDGIDVLVYNASVFRQKSPTELTEQELVEDFKINVVGAVNSAKLVAPNMKDQGWGSIFITGGGSALEPFAAAASLGIGKAAVRNYAFSLHQELKPSKINVCTITICGMVASNTKFDPDKIAQKYWEQYKKPANEWSREVIFE